jgi:hypothetical protein
MQVLLGSVGKKEDGDAEKVIDIQMAAAIAENALGKESAPASSLKLTRRRRVRDAIGRLGMQDNSNRMTNRKRKRKRNLGCLRFQNRNSGLELYWR